MKFLTLLLVITALFPPYVQSTPLVAFAAEACDEEWVESEVLAPATLASPDIVVTCNLNLDSDDVVTKRLVLEGAASSGVQVDCNGALLDGGEDTVNFRKDMIEIRSRSYLGEESGRPRWEATEDILITSCSVIGSVRIQSSKSTTTLKNRSRSADYVQWARDTAPRHITLNNLKIVGVGRNPVYFSVGVTESSLLNSEVKGVSDAVGIYLDAESAHNTLKDNIIHVDADGPQVAIDASEYNTVVNNYFSNLDTGGVYLYRNCGERGVIRHTTPSHNTIVNNIFYYDRYTEENHFGKNDPWRRLLSPAVYLGSRNGNDAGAGYCDQDLKVNHPWPMDSLDEAFPFGSSADNRDFARHNVVMQNQIYKRTIEAAIRSRDWDVNSSNYLDFNETVTAETVNEERLAGCYVIDGNSRQFILSERIVVLNSSRFSCRDGELRQFPNGGGDEGGIIATVIAN